MAPENPVATRADVQTWLEGLVGAAAARSRPPRGSDSGPAVLAAERAVLAAHLVSWIDTDLPRLLAERAAALPAAAAEPAIVLTTTAAGLAAADDVLGRDDPLVRQWRRQFACVTELDYRLWCKQHPDPGHRLHVNHWSWIKTSVPPQRWAAFEQWPLGPGEAYWLHRTGTVGAGPDRRFCHLWKWNGSTAALLRPFIDENVQGL